MTLAIPHTYPLNQQAAEYDDNQRDIIHLARSPQLPAGMARVYIITPNMETSADSHTNLIAEHNVMDVVEEAFTFDDYRDRPNHIEITLPTQ